MIEEPNDHIIEIDEEYKIWKKNCPFLYDVLLTKCLTWPSLTVSWMKNQICHIESNVPYNSQTLLLGTQTSEQETNQLIFIKLKYPKKDISNSINYNTIENKISVETVINHIGDVNRARANPILEHIIATKSSNGNIYLFNKFKHPSIPSEEGFSPQAVLKGHTAEGYGLSWNNNNSNNLLASGSDDRLVCIWDVEHKSLTEGKYSTLNPIITYSDHESLVEDVCFSKKNPYILGSVSDDCTLKIYDLRTSKLTFNIKAHSNNINCLDFNNNEVNLITGGSDKNIFLWDLRNMTKSIHCFESHKEDVMVCKFHPSKENLFASGSVDRRILVWNICSIGKEQTYIEKQDGPPELIVSIFKISLCTGDIYPE